MQEQLRVIEQENASTLGGRADEQDISIDGSAVQTYYEGASDVRLRDYGSYSLPRFITAVLDRMDRGYDADDLCLVDKLSSSKDIDFGLLLAAPDETLVFVGSDPTAKDSIPWFAFSIDPMEPVPAPESARDALDRLKPPCVRDIVHEENWIPNRHGEWWLLPTQCVPCGTVFKGQVASRPYGPSPLGNHVPRDYAFTVSDSEFMDVFTSRVGAAPVSVQSPPEALDWLFRQHQKAVPPDDIPRWSDIRLWAGDVLVRGTIRHRDNDHFVENCGEIWHRAETHDVQVYTGDEIATDIHLDYHGRQE